MPRRGVEEQRVARLHQIAAVAMPVANLSGQHVDELDARMTEMRVGRGILGKRIDTLELWHVEDIRFEQSFLDRILGVGNLMVVSHDDTTPKLMMHGLPDPRRLFETLKQRVIAVKRQRGVVKMDVGGHSDLTNS